MSNNKAWELDSLGRRVGPDKKEEILDLESRVDWSERFVSQHDRDIRQIRYEATRLAKQLQGQIQEQAQLIKGLRRLVGFLARVSFALVAAFFAWLVFSYLPDEILFSMPDEIFGFMPNGIYWKTVSALFVFLITVLVGNLLFRRRAASLFREPPRKQETLRNRTQSSRR